MGYAKCTEYSTNVCVVPRVRNTESLKILEFVYFISLFNNDLNVFDVVSFVLCKIGFFAMTVIKRPLS